MFGSARFVAPDEAEVTTADGQPWRTTFDPRTMRPAATLDRGCEPC
jgi:hypothetical protein